MHLTESRNNQDLRRRIGSLLGAITVGLLVSANVDVGGSLLVHLGIAAGVAVGLYAAAELVGFLLQRYRS